MAWKIEASKLAKKQLKKLDKQLVDRILTSLEDKLDLYKNPRLFGKPLKHTKSDLWRYRVGDYRILCEINNNELIILIITIGHRKEVYNESL